MYPYVCAYVFVYVHDVYEYVYVYEYMCTIRIPVLECVRIIYVMLYLK